MACFAVLIKTAHIIMDIHCLGVCFRFKVSKLNIFSDQGGESKCFELLLEVKCLSRCEVTITQGMEGWIIGSGGKEICLDCFCHGL